MPTIGDLTTTLAPIATSAAQTGIQNNGLNNATNTINQGITNAQGQISTATQQAIQTQQSALQQEQGIYGTAQTNAAPYQQQGQLSLAQLQQLAQNQFNPSSVATDPGYQFGLDQGQQGLQRAEAAQGTLGNGGSLKAGTRYALDYATTKYNDAYNRFLATQQSNLNIANAGIQAGENANQQVLSAGNTLSGETQQNANEQGNFGMTGATDNASLTLAGAQTTAQNQLGQSNNIASTTGVIGNTIGQLLKQATGNTGGVNSPVTVNPDTPTSTVGPVNGPPAPTDTGIDTSGIDTTDAGDTVQNLDGSIGTYAGTIGGLSSAAAGTAAAGGAAAGATPAVSVVIPGVTDAAGAAAGAGGAAGAAEAGSAAVEGATAIDGATEGAAVGTGEVSSGALSSVAGLMTNPITIGIGAAIGAALIWQATQVHPVANTFVQNYQNPFGKQLGNVVDSFDSALASGQLTKSQAQTAYTQTANLIQGFENEGATFAKQGGKQQTVWNQAQRTMAQDFGGTQNANGSWTPDWSKVLGKMQTEIANLPNAA